jgi:hypothetical protein
MNLPFPVCFGLPGPSRDHITVVVIRFVVRGFRDMDDENTGAVTRAMLHQQLLAHWKTLRPTAGPEDVAACVRCAAPSEPTCRFHPDAKASNARRTRADVLCECLSHTRLHGQAFAFGSGRFDFAFSSLWDTPHGVTILARLHAACANDHSHAQTPQTTGFAVTVQTQLALAAARSLTTAPILSGGVSMSMWHLHCPRTRVLKSRVPAVTGRAL